MGVRFAVLAALAALVGVPSAGAAGWLPSATDAEWVWEFNNSAHLAHPVKEKVTVRSATGTTFTLAWTSDDLENPEDTWRSAGTASFQNTGSGLVNTDWASTLPPPAFPILCGRPTGCGNSLASSLYLLIWGNRAPLLVEPLLRGTSWASTGGVEGDVSSVSTYLGRERVSVPAFPSPVVAAKVRTEVTQAGALGDPFGSGVRTVWWVYGVGPVRIVFAHTGGTNAPVSTARLLSTNRVAQAAPGDTNWFPLRKGLTSRYAWTNSKHMPKRSVQELTVEELANNSARVGVKHVSGPIRVAGSYGFALRKDGVTNIWGTTQAASLATFPPLGPRALPADKRRRFFTPYDLMVYGSNPVLPAHPAARNTWKPSRRDLAVFGATGTTTVLGVRPVRVAAGRFQALAVQSRFTQRGFPFGSGTRTAYYASGKGLVKLVFRHGDGSVSTVELLRQTG